MTLEISKTAQITVSMDLAEALFINPSSYHILSNNKSDISWLKDTIRKLSEEVEEDLLEEAIYTVVLLQKALEFLEKDKIDYLYILE